MSRGLHFGDGIFRTLLIWDEKPVDWSLHMEKLAADCAVLQLQVPEMPLLEAEALQLVRGQQRAVLKILVIRKSGGRGYFSATDESDRLLILQSAPQFPLENWTQGIKIFKSPIKLSNQPLLAGVKHLNRLEQVLASRGWPTGMDEAILANETHQPVCGTRSNLFWVKAGAIHTPLLDRCGVSGIMRRKIMQLSDAHGIKMHPEMGDWNVLHQADEIFVCNALIGIWPVREFEGRVWPTTGPVSRMFQDQLNQPKLC